MNGYIDDAADVGYFGHFSKRKGTDDDDDGGFVIASGVVIENAIGGNGDDEIIGNDVANELNGGAGKDNLWGHGEKDTFVFSSAPDADADTIKDFEIGVDKIDLSGIDALKDKWWHDYWDGDQAFSYSETTPKSDFSAGKLWFNDSTKALSGWVDFENSLSSDPASNPDFEIFLEGIDKSALDALPQSDWLIA